MKTEHAQPERQNCEDCEWPQDACCCESVRACRFCEGAGTISYNPNLNPSVFHASASSKCPHCDGTGIMTEDDANTFDDENNRANRHDAEPCSRSSLHFTHGWK